MYSSYLNSEIFIKIELYGVFIEEYLFRISSGEENIFPKRNIEKKNIDICLELPLFIILFR